jgi:ankyrin repeat protein
MMTPLLFCVNRGYMEIVRQLIDMGADRNCSDKNVSCGVSCIAVRGICVVCE